MGEPRVFVKAGREKPFRQGHPWVFSGAVERIEGETAPGDTAILLTSRGEFLGRGFVNPRSRILLRIATREDEPIDEAFFRRRLLDARRLRDRTKPGAEAARLVNSEGDFLPGLVADRYGPFVVVQIASAGIDRRREEIASLLVEVFGAEAVYERSDSPAREEEGLPPRRAPLLGPEPPDPIEFEENGLRFAAHPATGQKTGFYLDQSGNRALCRSLASGARVLDAFAYTGGFSVSAAAGGAREIVVVEDSAHHLEAVEQNLQRNGLLAVPHTLRAGNAFGILRERMDPFDLVVLDPPPFARSRSKVEAAARGYKDVNLLAFRLLAPGGLLLTFSCSHHVDPTLFQQIVFAAAADSGRSVRFLARLGPPPDHPVSLHHPQGEYLKGLLCSVA